MEDIASGLIPEEEQLLINLLGKVTPKNMTAGVFNAVAKIFRLPAIELVCLRLGASARTEVLLSQRPADDPIFPGQWHTSGTIARLSDASPFDSLKRLAKKELGITLDLSALSFTGICYSNHNRGGEIHIIYVYVFYGNAPDNHQFFPIDNLPQPFMEHHHAIIKLTMERFQKI
ncbi:MAG: hypothetical protein WC610_03925 [Patescibacteria group bacterium]